MDSGGNMQSNEERNAEKQMDNYLKAMGFHRKKIAKDGSCLFRAVAEQVLHCQSLHTEVRTKCVEFLKQNRDSYEAFIEGNFEEYLSKLQDPQQWVGEVEINALAVMYNEDPQPDIFQQNAFKHLNSPLVRLCFLNGNHYDSVYPISHMKSAALCQSILYELLYEGVFRVDRSSLPCQRMSRATDLLSDDCMAVCGSSDESDQETHDGFCSCLVPDPLWVTLCVFQGRGRARSLPERVRRSLNPTLLRNVDYDIWHKTKRGGRDRNSQLRLHLNLTALQNHKLLPNISGRVSVLLVSVSWMFEAFSSLTEWEGRGRGRGRGKPIPASSSSSVSQATAVGSSGRMQKQHSWPPQATVEEQEKPSRSEFTSFHPDQSNDHFSFNSVLNYLIYVFLLSASTLFCENCRRAVMISFFLKSFTS
uniref:ubiquitinyl hydrolase 1 n=1 Tax=Xiphophorus couchianus TaxID=32473 RepID=A0A3B5LG52_9TELE